MHREIILRAEPEVPPGGVELSERRLRELAEALRGSADPLGRRSALRVPVEGFVTMVPLSASGTSQEPRRAGVYDLSHSGVAIVTPEPIEPATKFNLLFPRDEGKPMELLCTARHTRRHGEAFITGASFGVPWLAAIGAAMVG